MSDYLQPLIAVFVVLKFKKSSVLELTDAMCAIQKCVGIKTQAIVYELVDKSDRLARFYY